MLFIYRFNSTTKWLKKDSVAIQRGSIQRERHMGQSHRLVRDKLDTWGKYRNGTKTAHDERISHSRAQKFKSSEKKEAVLFCWGVIFKALLGSTHKGNWTKCASEKMLLSLTVIATKITIIGPIKVILNEQYVILMFLYLRKGVFLISSDCLAQIHFKCH